MRLCQTLVHASLSDMPRPPRRDPDAAARREPPLPAHAPLHIKKYPNRRFYDSTRGRNVSLAELHALIVEGHDLVIVDSATEQDITNQILTQLILERHATKLAIFPPAILHQIIRTQEQLIGTVIEQFIRQTLDAQQAVQTQWAETWRQMLAAANPGASGMPDWARWWTTLAPTMRAPGIPLPPTAAIPRSPANESHAPPSPATDDLGDLRRQIDALSQRLAALDAVKERAQRAGDEP